MDIFYIYKQIRVVCIDNFETFTGYTFSQYFNTLIKNFAKPELSPLLEIYKNHEQDNECENEEKYKQYKKTTLKITQTQLKNNVIHC